MENYIDIYCERLVPGLMAEPVNAITNLAFFVAAFFAYRLAKREDALHFYTKVLILVVVLIGTGSTVFHTFATSIAMLMDTLPILFYQLLFLYFYAHHVLQYNFSKVGILLGLFMVGIYGFGMVPESVLNGSLSYAPAYLFLKLLALLHYLKYKKERWEDPETPKPTGPKLLFLAGCTFLLSLTFRTVDMSYCDVFPLGTHFLWHILNGAVLYLTMRAYILNTRPTT